MNLITSCNYRRVRKDQRRRCIALSCGASRRRRRKCKTRSWKRKRKRVRDAVPL